jgi:small nuclear ribonucleoprotein (snRNP)-like protein
MDTASTHKPYSHLSEPTSSAERSRPALAAFQRLLRRSIRLTTIDGRVFLGTLVGADKAMNILMVSTHEYRPGEPPGARTPQMEGGRFIGQAMVPWKRVVKVEVEGTLDEEDLYT